MSQPGIAARPDASQDDETASLPLHLLIVGAFPPPGSVIVGGIATSCRVLLESSLPKRARLTLVDSSQASNPPPGLVVRALRALRRLCVFVAEFESKRPQVVALFSSPGASTAEKGVMGWYARLRGRAVLLLPRGVPPAQQQPSWLARRAWDLAFGGATRVVCQGAAWQQFATHSLGLAAHAAPVLVNWTATPDLIAIGRARAPRAAGPVRLLYLGWVERDKGILDLLEACLVLAPRSDFTLDIVGAGHALDEARQWIQGHGLASRVTCHGWLHGAEKLQRLAGADVLALPSWAEGLPNAMIEAMACKLACVVSAVGNIPATIGDSGAAILVPARDVAALARELQRVIDDPVHRQRVASAGHALAEREFGAERAVDRLLSIAQESLERAPR